LNIFGGGADFLQEAVLSLDEPELEAMLNEPWKMKLTR
jgi:hypothetical protein